MPNYIFVLGGVISGLGKGVTSASICRILIELGYRVNIKKEDPYLNIDPGTMGFYFDAYRNAIFMKTLSNNVRKYISAFYNITKRVNILNIV